MHRIKSLFYLSHIHIIENHSNYTCISIPRLMITQNQKNKYINCIKTIVPKRFSVVIYIFNLNKKTFRKVHVIKKKKTI